MPADSATGTATGLTVAELARLLRVGEDRVRSWIRSGRLGAINTADPSAAKPRFVVLPDQLQAFIRTRSVVSPPKPAARRPRLKLARDYYP